MTFEIKVFKGPEITPFVRVISEMRLEAFYEFPYLYVGAVEEDAMHTQDYARTPQGLFVAAFVGGDLVGFCTGMPFRTPGTCLTDWCDVLEKENHAWRDYYYGGEVIVQRAFRGKGTLFQLKLVEQFKHEVEALGFPGILWVTAIRAVDHPLRPQDYVDVASRKSLFCIERTPLSGIVKTPVVFSMPYPTRQPDGSVIEEMNHLACWIMPLYSTSTPQAHA